MATRQLATTIRHLLVWLIEPFVLIPCVAVLVLLLVWSATISSIATDKREATEASLLLTERLLDTYEAQTLRVLNEVSQSLRLIAYARRFAGDNGALHQLQGQNLLLPRLVFTTRLVSGDGRLLASSSTSASDEPVQAEVIAHHAKSDTIFVSQPYKHGNAGEPVIDISRTVNEQAGGEIIVITMPASYLVSDYDEGRFGRHGVLALVGTDGVFRAKRIGDQVVSGERTDYAKLLPADGEPGTANLRDSPWDGVRRYMSARSLYGVPLAVIVGLSEHERSQAVLDQSNARMLRAWTITAAVVGFALVLTILTFRIRRLREVEQIVRAEHARSIEHMAYHDSLTKLPNRAYYSQKISEYLTGAHSGDAAFALLLIDLDGFKKVNDLQGHQIGDLLLIEVARRINQCVREGDFVARLGGDEFVVVLNIRKSPEEISPIARRLVARIAEPYDLNGHQASVSASVGVATYPSDGTDEGKLTNQADRAMYLAKERGKNTVVFADVALN